MGKKAEAAAIRDKAIDRFLKLRAKIQLISKNSASASDDRDSARVKVVVASVMQPTVE